MSQPILAGLITFQSPGGLVKKTNFRASQSITVTSWIICLTSGWKIVYIFSFKKSKKYRLNGENLLTQRISLKLSPGCDSKWQYILLRNGLWWFGEDEYVKVGNWASVGSSQRSLNPSLEAQVMRNSCQWFKVHGLKWSRSQSLQSSLHPQKWPIQPRSQGPKAFRSGQWWILSSCSSLKVRIQR